MSSSFTFLASAILSVIALAIMIQQCACVIYNWDFNDPPDSNLAFRGNSTNIDITIQDLKYYIKFDEVTTTVLTRPSNGMITLNPRHRVEISEVSFNTDMYSVYMEVYIFRAITQYLFCIPINITTNGPSGVTPKWCVHLSQGTNLNIVSNLYDGDERFECQGLISGVVMSGWNAFRLSIQRSSTPPYYSCSYDATCDTDGGFLTRTNNTYSDTNHIYDPDGLFGQFNAGSTYLPFTGIIDVFAICDDISFCGYSSALVRDTLIQASKKLYHYHWPMNDAYNSYDDYKVISHEQIQKDNNSVNFTIYNSDNLRVVYPTDNGWLSLYRDSWINTEPFEFNNGPQFTIEFEFLKFYYDSVFAVYPWFEENDQWNQYWTAYRNRMWAGSKDTPLAFDLLDPYKWTKVMYSYTYDEDSDKIMIAMGRETLRNQTDSGATTCVYNQYHVDGSGSKELGSAFTTQNTMSIRIKSLQGIIRNVKYYPWAMNQDTCSNHGEYEDPDNSDYKYQQDVWNKYLWKFYNNDWQISNENNACLNYFTNQQQVCMNLRWKKYEYCHEGFTSAYFHCIDYCGDGIVQMSPRMLECDDGNNNDGDGCSKNCIVEDYWLCEVDPLLQNKSYCQPACGSGTLQADTEVCDDGNRGSGDGCESDCTVTYKYSCQVYLDKPSYCTPACGNSLRNPEYGETCDDGNNMDFDGCSKDCRQEYNYICTQVPGQPDVCETEFPRPVPVTSAFDQTTNTVTVEFDQQMMNQTMKNDSVIVFVESPGTEIEFSYTTKFEGKNFIVTITPTLPFVGGIGEKITLILQEIEKFRSNETIPMLSAVAFIHIIPAFPVSGSAESSGKGASFTFLITVGVSLGVSMLTGGSAETMWSLANTLQILFFMGMIELEYPSDLENTFKIMAYSNFENPLTKYVTSIVFFGVNFINSPVSTNFGNLGFESTNILVNSFDKIGMIFILFLSAFILSCIYRKVKDSKSRTARCIRKIDKSIRYESFTRFVVELILNLSVACWINIWYGSTTETQDIIAFVVSILTLFGMFLLTAYGIYYPAYHFEDIKMNPVTHERHCLFFVDFKKDKIKQLLYFGFFMMRRMLLAFVIVCMKEHPQKQLILCFFMFVWQLYYCVINKPYVSSVNNVLNVYNECILILFTILLYLFTRTNDSQTITKIGWACIGVIIVFFLVNWIIIFPVLIYQTVKSCKRKKIDKSMLDEGGPMMYNIRNPLHRAFKRPGFSIEELRRKIKENHPQNNSNNEITITKAPAINLTQPHAQTPQIPKPRTTGLPQATNPKILHPSRIPQSHFHKY